MESRTEFLSNEEVKDFINHFSNLITGKTFKHAYEVRDNMLPKNYEKTYLKDGWLGINSFEDAWQKYWAAEKDFNGNAKILNSIKKDAKKLKSGGNNNNYSDVIEKILEWGAGGNRGISIFKGNWEWAKNNQGKIAQIMRRGIDEMESKKPDASVFDNKKGPRMNAGYSKFYAMACRDVIIYDSRVAAALGLIVKRYLKAKGQKSIPSLLHFRWGLAQGETMRNPSDDAYKFKKLDSANPKFWAESNIRANWLIKAALDEAYKTKPKLKWSGKKAKVGKKVDMRMVEAALFVIGYHVKPAPSQCFLCCLFRRFCR